MKKRWKCTLCGQIFEGEQPPVPCPVCGAGEEAFVPLAAEPTANRWKCTVCGQIFEGAQPPEPCPVCGAGKEAFVPLTDDQPAKRWKCTVCGQIFEGAQPPVPCPVCGAGKEAFVPVSEDGAGPKATSRRFVLVGGGAAAASAAAEIRRLDRTAPITMICGEGIIPYNRPGLSDFVAGEADFAALALHPFDWYEENRVRLICDAQAVSIDPEKRCVRLSDGRGIPYDELLLATGANAFCPVQGAEGAVPVQVLRRFADALALTESVGPGSRVLVVGGGILGVEAALGLQQRGAGVTIVELGARLVGPQADDEAAARLRSALEHSGIAVFTGCSVASVTAEGAQLSDGRLLEADLVLVSAGIRSELTLAGELGLELGRGIKVDEWMRTSLPGVCAAGDCAEFEGRVAGLWNAALEMGLVAAATMCGEQKAPYRQPVPATALSMENFTLFSAGRLSGDGLQEVVREEGEVYRKLLFENDRLVGLVAVGPFAGAAAAISAIDRGDSPQAAAALLN